MTTLVIALVLGSGYPWWGEIGVSVVLAAVWIVGGTLCLLVTFPVAAALVFKQTPTKTKGASWGQWVNAALVVSTVSLVLGAHLDVF